MYECEIPPYVIMEILFLGVLKKINTFLRMQVVIIGCFNVVFFYHVTFIVIGYYLVLS